MKKSELKQIIREEIKKLNEFETIKFNKNGYVIKIISPYSRKIVKTVIANSKKYRYNSTYKTYNSVNGNELLHKSKMKNLKISESKLNEKASYLQLIKTKYEK